MSDLEVAPYMNLVKNTISSIKGYEQIFIPVRNKESEVQCLNPYVLNNKEEIKKMKHTLKEVDFNTNKILDSIPYLSRRMLMIEKNTYKF